MSTCSPNSGPRKPNSLKLDMDRKTTVDYADGDVTKFNHIIVKPLNLVFNDVSYSVPTGILTRGRRKLLSNISGDFRSGELTAIMGPSGAGKSTLMDILSGFTIASSITGRVAINGENRNLTAFRRSSAYIMQDDNLQPLLTIDETMRVAADLKLRSNHREKMQRIDEILLAMGLVGCRNTRTDHLSGGQRKRLAIALELVHNPPIMFFDEPTSGLDSVTSKQCISLLNSLASQGRTVIFTIHQASATLFSMIDHLYVIADGSCVYAGGTRALVPFLTKNGLQCPTYHNPADFLMEVCNGDHGDYVQKLGSSIDNGKCNDWRSSATVDWNKVEEMIASRLNVNLQVSARLPPSPITPLYCESRKEQDPAYYATGFWKQLYILLRRNAIKLSRDKVLTFMRLGMHIIIAILVGTIYYRIGEDAAHVFDNFNLLFFNIMFLMFSAFSATIITFPSELPIVTREHFNRWYKLRSFYLANKIADLPVQIAAASAYTLIIFFMTGQFPELKRLGLFILICTLISLVAQIIGVIVGTGMKLQNAVVFGPLFILPFLIFSGFFVHLNDAHPYLHWLFHTSFLKYGFQGVMAAIYGFDRPKMPCSEIYCHFATPEKLLSEVDMKNVNYWFSVSILLGLYLMLDVTAYMTLRLRLKVRRAYIL